MGKWENGIEGGRKWLAERGENYMDFEDHGLRGVYRESALNLPNSSFTYREAKGDPRQIHISCISDAWRGAYPFCRGYFYWPDDRLGIHVDFLKDRLPEWDSMVENIHAMVIGWHDDAVRK